MRGGSWLASPLVAERQTQLNRPQEQAREVSAWLCSKLHIPKEIKAPQIIGYFESHKRQCYKGRGYLLWFFPELWARGFPAPQAKRAQAGQALVLPQDRLTPYPHRHACYNVKNPRGFFNSIDTHVIMRGGSWLASPLVAERQTQLNTPKEQARELCPSLC